MLCCSTRSLQGQHLQALELGALRMDHHERMANALNDFEISPTRYMLAYLRQRGWKLPHNAVHIPNILDSSNNASQAPAAVKPVWRVAFFGRVEERKVRLWQGISLTCDTLLGCALMQQQASSCRSFAQH